MKSKKQFNKKKHTRRNQRLILPVFAASKSLYKTRSLSKAVKAYKTQALFDAKKLFSSVSV